MIEYQCTYPGCRKTVESKEQPYCQHGQALVSMRRAVTVTGSRYEPKPTARSMKGAYSE